MAGRLRAVADTHAAIWYLWQPDLLSPAALSEFEAAESNGDRIGLSTISLCEVVLLVEKERIRHDAFHMLLRAVDAPDGVFNLLNLGRAVVLGMKSIERRMIPDLPDRIIAATALSLGVPLITKDGKIQRSSVTTIW